MDKREAQLLNAAREARAKLAVLCPHNHEPDGSIIPGPSEILRKIDAALRNYVPPITSEPGFDARDNSSLGMKEDFGMGEVK